MGRESPTKSSPPPGAVFLSYASQDAAAAKRICHALRAVGIEVWFDQSELRGGDVWDQTIRRQIRECALFVPLISGNTQARLEGYFRREWKLAVDRTHDMAAAKPFLVPVVIDGTSDQEAEVPEAFRAVQWTRLPEGQTPPGFAQRVSHLLTPGVHVAPPSAGTTRPAATFWLLRHGPLLLAAGATVAGGYFAFDRFLMSKRVAEPLVATSTAASSAQNAIPQKSIAVLPFVDVSEKHDQEYFSDGLAEELIDQLTHSTSLKVIARTSSFQFKGRNEDARSIASKLGVAYLLEGSVRKDGRSLRIATQLIRATDGTQQWSQTYDRELSEIFKVQEEIAGTVAQTLKVVLNAANGATQAPSSSVDAYNLVLQGNFLLAHRSRRNVEQAIGLYEEALKVDANDAVAMAQLGRAYFYEGVYGWSDRVQAAAKAKRTEIAALRINPNLIRAHLVLAFTHMVLEWDWEAARSEIDKIRQIDPNDATALPRAISTYLSIFGRIDESIAITRLDLERDPLDAVILHNLGEDQFRARRYSECVSTIRKLLTMSPDRAQDSSLMGLALLSLGQNDDALAAVEREPDEAYRFAALPIVFWAAGRHRDSDAALGELIEKFPAQQAYAIARAYAYRSELTLAFHWLDRAYKQHDADSTWLKTDPLLDKLRGDPRYQAFLVKMKLDGDGQIAISSQ